jgi:hypothetical protein
LLPPSGGRRRTAKNAYLECFLKEKSSPEGPLPNPWAFWLRRVRDSAHIGKCQPVGWQLRQMGFRGRRNPAGASSRPWHGRNRASSWPDPAAMCNDRAPPKKAPGREPGARGAECIIAPLAGAQGGVLDADRASPAFAQRSAINRRSVRGRALGAARQKRLPCRHRECAARRGAAARRRGLSSATIKGRRQHNPPIPSQTRYAKPSEARRPSRRPTGARQSDRKTYILRLHANLHVGPYIAASRLRLFD